MARRKRASLKDKGPEALGMTPKKGKGIDMLFGGPLEEDASSDAEVQADENDESSAPEPQQASSPASQPQSERPVSASDRETVVTPPPAPEITTEVQETLPVNEADDDDTGVVVSSEEVDELGLPVAMEAPPSDLEYATMSTEPTTDAGQEETFDSSSPFAAPPPPSTAGAEPVSPQPAPQVDLSEDDLSGLLQENDLSGLVEDESLSGPGPAQPAVPPPVSSPPPTPAASTTTPPDQAEDDLSGLASDADLSGMDTGSTADAAAIPPANLPPSPPPPSAAPTFSTPSASASTPPPSTPSGFAPQPPPAPATPSGQVRSLPSSRVESLGGIMTEQIEVDEEDLLPADLAQQVEHDNIIGLADRAQVARDDAIAAEVARYIGQERREHLDHEIEHMYEEVAKELSVNKADAEFALKTLSSAQDIILEDPRQYDEALYRVAVVKAMLARKRNLRRWSYTWGSFVFFYAIVWLIAFMAGFLSTDFLRQTLGSSSEEVTAVRAAWFSALAGGVGGIIGVFYSLYWHVAMKQDFDRQYVMYYFVQPIMGFVLGAVIFFILEAGFGTIGLSGATNDTVVAVEIVLGWIAGFRQRVVFEVIDKIVQRVLGKDKDQDNADPVSLAPPGESL